MNKNEVAELYLKWLNEEHSEITVTKILNHLNSLVDTGSDKPLSYESKLSIIDEMIELSSSLSYEKIFEQADNQSILQLIQQVKQELKEGEEKPR